MKRILFLSDLHCGHFVGLTHPDFFMSGKIGDEQRELWSWFKKQTSGETWDHVVVNGDLIEGKGLKSGGTELITSDRSKQVDMSVAALKTVKRKKMTLTYGTPYHTGSDEDWEDRIAKELEVRIKSQLFLLANGVTFDIRHHIGGSSIPHATPPSLPREAITNMLWSERDIQPRAQITIRGHLHRHLDCGNPHWRGMVLPALQGLGSKFGSRKCSGMVDFGVVVFEVTKAGNFSWQSRTCELKLSKAEVIEA